MKEYIPVMLEIFGPLLMAVGTIVVGIVGQKAAQYLGSANEKVLRDALHQSADNAVKYAQQRLGPGALTQTVINSATEYVINKNPETLKKLGVNAGAVQDIIRTKLPPS